MTPCAGHSGTGGFLAGGGEGGGFVLGQLVGRQCLAIGGDGFVIGTLVGGFLLLAAAFLGGLAFLRLLGFLPPLPLGFGDEALGGGMAVRS